MRAVKAAVIMLVGLGLFAAGAAAEVKPASPGNLASLLAEAEPGDVILLADGVYEGGFEIRRSGREGAPITIKAAGEAAVFEGGENCLLIENASWITVEGILCRHAERAGIFARAPADAPASHITVRGCTLADNGTWGFISGHVDYLTVEDNEAYGSKIQHGIYVSNSGDHTVVRGNRIHHNNMCGLHMNGDPECGGDGVMSYMLVENNVIWENGINGGSALNLTHVQDSLFRNNLLYHNHAGGIVSYYDTGGEKCASKRNKFVNNTVYFRAGQGRWALSLKRNSTDAFVKNNILVGGIYGAIQAEESSLPGLVMDSNIIANHPGQQFSGDSSEDISITVEAWREMGHDVKSVIGEMPKFADEAGGGFRLIDGSVGIDNGESIADLAPFDIEGAPRPQGEGFDCGCYEKNAD